MALASNPPAAGHAQTTGTKPMEVLILDDERFDRHRLARLCSGLGFPCVVSNARTLTEFGDHLDQTHFGLILLDYALPDGTGLDALEMVQLSARNLNTPTIMISGQAAPQVAGAARNIGCARFLSKDDLSAESFAQAIQMALPHTGPDHPVQGLPADTAQIEALLSRGAARSARDIKPMVSRMLRQLRDLRRGTGDQQADGLAAVEQNCMSLWSYLVDMERREGAALLADLADPALPGKPVARPAGRPPSPFSSRGH